MTYPTGSVVYETSAAGSVATAKGKSISCSGTAGTTTCLVFGINAETMANGTVATIGFRIQPGTTATSADIGVSNFSASSAEGTSLGTATPDGGTITINQPVPVNNAPTATDAAVATNEDTARGITLAGTDPDGNPLTFSIVNQPTKGGLTGSGANRTYTPNANANGADSITFQVNDGQGGTDNGTISITITPVNDAPTAQDQAVSTAENTAKAITLGGSDVEGSALTFSITSGPAHGTVSGGTGASRTYTPANGYSGPDSFNFQVSDGTANDSGTVSITVTAAPNNSPTATDAATSTNEDTPKAITLGGTDPDSDPLTFTVMSQPGKGTLSGTAPTLMYTPNANANGADSFTFQANDGQGGTDNGTISITITPQNDAPTTQNQAVQTGENTPKAITLTGSDVDGNTLTFSVTSGPSHGTVTGGTGAGRTYTPTSGYSGPDSFNFQVNDGNGGTANGTINITVTDAPNNPPTATDAATSTNEDTPKAIVLTGTDPDSNPLTFAVMSQPGKGTLSGTAPSLMYTPNANANGADSFTFQANDGQATDNGTINITITPVNDPPTAQNQAVSTAENTAKAITLTGSDVEGSALTFSITSGPAHGTVSGGTGASRTYTPANGYSGPDSFNFQVSDGTTASTNATVTVTVTDTANNPPTATDAAAATNEDTAKAITLAGTDPDGDPLTFTMMSQPTKGSVTGSGANRMYTPNANANGADSFTFQANDNKGGTDNGTINITIAPLNDPPTTQNQAVSTALNTAKAITLTGSDVDGDTLTFSTSGGPSHGTLTGTGANRTYTPANGYSGADSFNFQVNDGKNGTANGAVSITVNAGQNSPPTATGSAVTTNEDTPKAITFSGTDPNGDTLSYSIVTPPTKGSLSGNGANRMYTPNPNANGSDSCTFKVDDGKGGTANGVVSITITPLNDPPTAQTQSVSTQKNKSRLITLAGNDVDGDSLAFSLLTQPAHGALSGNAPNLTYNPTNGYSGPDSLKFRVSDGKGSTADGTVNITVTGGSGNKPPKASSQSVTTQENKSRSITLQGSDEDGDTLSFSVTNGPSHGALSGNAPNLTYTPGNGYHGSDSFTFQVNDNKGGTGTGTVSIDVVDAVPLGLQSVTCNGSTLTGGGSRTCHVFLNNPAPNGGVNVALSCATKQLSVPASARIAAKANSVSFKISSALVEVAETVQLSASMGGSPAIAGQVAAANGNVSTTLSLVPLQPTSLSCLPVQIRAGRTLTCEATLNSSGFSESASLSVKSSPDVKVPDSLPLRPGRSSVSFRASISETAAQQSATITVGLYGGQASSTVSIISSQGPIIKVDSPQVISAGKKLTFEVTARDPNELPVTLSAANLPPGANFDAPNGRFTWTPSEAQAGSHSVTFKATNSADIVAQKAVTIEVILGTMKIFSFTNAASSSGDRPCSPGSLATVWGVGFTDGSSERARGFPLPTTLNGIRVDINSRSARLLYVGPRQINLQCPSLPAGTALSIKVERRDTGESATWSAPSVSMKEASPAIFSLDGSGTGQGLVIIANTPKIAMLPNPNFDAQAAAPAEPGDHLVIYANGLGLVDHEVPDGEPAAASPLSQVVSTVRVKVGDVFMPVTFAGLAPNMAGVYQVNTVLSEFVPSGAEVPVILEVQLSDGTVLQSNIVTIAIGAGTPRFGE